MSKSRMVSVSVGFAVFLTIIIVEWLTEPVFRTDLVSSSGYLVTVIAPIVMASVLGFVLQAWLHKREYLENQKNLWLKKHNTEVSGKLVNPLKDDLVGGLLADDRFSYFTPKREVISYVYDNDGSMKSIKVEYNEVYDTEPYSEPNVRDHIVKGYGDLDDKLKSAIKHTKALYPSLTEFNNNIHDAIINVINAKEPGLTPAVTYSETSDAYYPRMLVEAIYSQLKDKIDQRKVSLFTDTGERSTRRKIYSGGTTVANFVNHPGASAFTDALNCVYVEFLDSAKNLVQEVGGLREEWRKVYEGFSEIGHGFQESGIPLKGDCNVCRKTKNARELVPYSGQ